MSDTTRPVPGRTPTDAERGRRRKALFQRAWIVTWSVLAVGLNMDLIRLLRGQIHTSAFYFPYT